MFVVGFGWFECRELVGFFFLGGQRFVGIGKGGEGGVGLSVAGGVMAAGGSRARADYDYLVRLLLIGDSGICFVPSLYQIAVM